MELDQPSSFEHALQQALGSGDSSLRSRSAEDAFARLETKITKTPRADHRVRQPAYTIFKTSARPSRRRHAVFAGLMACGLAVAAVMWQQSITRNTAGDANSLLVQYSTANGQRATVTLRDGTQVMLNAGSQIRLSPQFGVENREIELDGEAKFTVIHDTKLPLVVRANGVLVRDLATEFNVRAYRDIAGTQVAVREGKVSVQSRAVTAEGAVAVEAGYVAFVAADGIAEVTSLSANNDAFTWTDGELVLRQAPLGEALIRLSRWYGVEFRAQDSSLLTHSISSRFPVKLSMTKVNDIADVLDATVINSGETITFIPNP